MNILLVAATTTDTTGYGIMTKGFLESIYKLKDEGIVKEITVLTSETQELSDSYDLTITVINPGALKDLISKNSKMKDIYAKTKRNAFNIIFETDKLPDAWSYIFDMEFITDYIVQSDFMRDQVREKLDKSAWDTIWNITPAIDETKIEEIPMSLRLQENKFRVLTVGQYTIRKGLVEAITAFTRELGETPDAEMILKYNMLSRVETDPLDTFQSIIKSNTRIGTTINNMSAISHQLDYVDILKLYQSASVLLIPSRGEGFGIPAIESMFAGTPVIYTNWSALPELCGVPGNYPIDYFLDEAVGMLHYGYEKGSRYAIPLIGSTMDALKLAYTTWKTNREQYYTSNRDIMVSRYGTNAVLNQMRTMVNGTKTNS